MWCLGLGEKFSLKFVKDADLDVCAWKLSSQIGTVAAEDDGQSNWIGIW